MTQRFSGKVAIVTGASRGIGRGIALRLARDGAAVMLAARDESKLAEAAAEIAAAGGRAASVALDLSEAESARVLSDRTLAEFGRVDLLINNAGATKRGDFLALQEADWTDGFALKFFGTVRLTRACWPHLKAAGGSVLNIAGVGGRTPGAQFAIGGSVNAALLSFTKAIAELGIADGVQVNAVNPGPVKTDRLNTRLVTLANEQGIGPAEAAKRMVEQLGVTRFGEVEDVANYVAFIMSPEGRWLHGALIDLDGGQTKTI